MTPTQAQRTQDAARARGAWLTWFVAERAGRVVAWAVVADQHGGTRVPGELQANTLDQLRAMLPAGLKRTDRSAVMGSEVVEVWD